MDRSEGWDGVAEQFMSARSGIGASLVRSWARSNLPPSGCIVDVGCGSGVPIAQALIEDGFTVFGIDASPALIAAFHQRFPAMAAACEPAQESVFFHRNFEAVISIGLLFLLSADDQRRMLQRVANVLRPSGRFLFSAPDEPCEWHDNLTGRQSKSLGRQEYEQYLDESGLRLVGCYVDEGENNYFDAVKPATAVCANSSLCK